MLESARSANEEITAKVSVGLSVVMIEPDGKAEFAVRAFIVGRHDVGFAI